VAKSQKALKLFLVSLGCAKNLVDSERILALCEGMGLAPAEDARDADIAVINTCAFIKEAEEEARDSIRAVKASLKPGARLVVLGCLPARHGKALDLPEADLALPRSGYHLLPERLPALLGKPAAKRAQGRLAGSPFDSWGRARSTPPWRAWLKIAEGCSHACTYCIIPRLRGKLESAPMDGLLSEARRLVRQGCLELTVVAQDVLAWRSGPDAIEGLAKGLDSIKGLKWLRLMYCHPDTIGPRLVRGLRRLERVTPYLDVPFQHASMPILKAMGRRADPYAVVDMIRRCWPEAALRSTFMAGFPGETDRDFEKLAEFLESAEFEHAGFFKFSPEEGSRAASLPGQVPEHVKEWRRERLASIQEKVTERLNRKRIGQVLEILADGPAPESSLLTVGRAFFQAPDVDGLVYFNGAQPTPGAMVKGRITDASKYDLVAEVEE
jgi:ribosomal protein S12 methylthiotransferase